MAYDSPSGDTLIFAVNEALFFGKIWNTHCYCLNKFRIMVYDASDPLPRQYTPVSILAIFDPVSNVTLPFALHGCISYLPVQLPTEHKLQTCQYIELTSDSPWDPYDNCFQLQDVFHISQSNFQQNTNFKLANILKSLLILLGTLMKISSNCKNWHLSTKHHLP